MKLEVKSQKRSVNIIFDNSWRDFVYLEKSRRSCNVVIIFDKNTESMFSEHIKDIPFIVVPDKQSQKTRPCLDSIQEKLFGMFFKKSDLLVGVGGGVVQDLTALSAAGYLGGIDWISVPTTFNSIVNPMLKGQLNTALGKNTLSYFSPPSSLVIDLNTTSQLTDQSLLIGLVELVRIAVSYDVDLFNKLEKKWVDFFIRDEKLILGFIKPAVKAISKQYSADFNTRLFGYTLAETIDWGTRYNVPHGIALLFCMEVELNAGIAAGVIKSSFTDRIRSLFRSLLEKYPYTVSYGEKIKKIGAENIMMPLKYVMKDKDMVPVMLPQKIGKLLPKPVDIPFAILRDEFNKFFDKEVGK
jgi:3-dehydroquinate synthase